MSPITPTDLPLLAENLLAFRDRYGSTLLHTAKDPAWAKMLVDMGLSIESKDLYGTTPLNAAIGREDIEMVKFFIEQGADLRATSANGLLLDTAICIDFDNNDTVFTSLLLEAGCDANQKNPVNGETVLHCAASYNEELVELLLQYGADPSILDNQGRPPVGKTTEIGQLMAKAATRPNALVIHFKKTTTLSLGDSRAEMTMEAGSSLNAIGLKSITIK